MKFSRVHRATSVMHRLDGKLCGHPLRLWQSGWFQMAVAYCPSDDTCFYQPVRGFATLDQAACEAFANVVVAHIKKEIENAT